MLFILQESPKRLKMMSKVFLSAATTRKLRTDSQRGGSENGQRVALPCAMPLALIRSLTGTEFDGQIAK
jgi:hypothetical protein